MGRTWSWGKKGQFALNAAILTASSMAMRLLGMAFTAYLSNKIGAEGVGVYQLLLSVYSFGVTLSIGGVGLASTRLAADQLARGRPAGARSAVFKCACIGLVCSLLASALLFWGADKAAAAWFHGKISGLPLRALALSLPFMAAASALSGYFTAVRRAVKSASAQILEQLTHMLAASALLTVAAPRGLEPACLALAAGSVLSEICSFLYLLLLYRQDIRRLGRGGSEEAVPYRRALSICLPVGLSSLVRSAINMAKQIMVPIGLEKHGVNCDLALAQYGAIRGMAMPILQFPSALLTACSSLLIPEITEESVRGGQKRINRLTSRVFQITLLFSVGTAGILFVYAQPLSMAFYRDPQAAHFLRILAPIVVIMYLDDMTDALLKGLDQQARLARINIAESFLSLLLLAGLLPSLGIYGYLACLFFSEIFNGALSVNCLIEKTGLKLRWGAWLLRPALCAAAACWLARRLAPGDPLWAVPLACGLYLLLLVLTARRRSQSVQI